MVANHSAALAIRARRPIVAGCILGSGNSCAVLLSSGKHIVLVGSVTATIDHHALLIGTRDHDVSLRRGGAAALTRPLCTGGTVPFGLQTKVRHNQPFRARQR